MNWKTGISLIAFVFLQPIYVQADPLELHKNDHISIIGNTLADRMQHDGWLESLIQSRFPNSEVRFIDTVCRPTKERQSAAMALAQKCDVVVVIGGAHSNNTHELVRTCSRFCRRVYHVQSADELQPKWFADAETVGITAGTSTPDSTIEEVEGRLMEFRQDSFQQEPTSVLRGAETVAS